jgi:tetratricopeptide (TPR) repeat protein
VLAEVLTTQFLEVSAREPEIIALHYARANQIESAIPNFLRAGQRAQERSALREAASHLKNGLEWLKDLPEGETRDRLELTLLLPLSGPLIATSGYSNPEVEQVCARALELCNAIGAGPDLPFAIYGLTTYYLNVSNLERCREVSEMLMLRSEESEYELHRVAAHGQLAFVHFFLGNLETSLQHSKQVMAGYRREDIKPLAARYGQDPLPTAYAQASLTAWQLGHVDLALEYGREAWSLPEANNDPFTQAAGGVYLTLVYAARREREDARRMAKRTLELCEHQNFLQWGNQAKVVYGWALADGSESTAEGLADMRAGLEQLTQVGAVIGAPMFTSLLIEALMVAGVRDLALATVSQTLNDSKVRGNVWMDAELLRLKALLLAEADQPQLHEVRELLDQSIAGAQKTGSRIYEVRSLCAAHRFGIATDTDYWRLAELDEGLTEGRETADLQEMMGVLAERG